LNFLCLEQPEGRLQRLPAFAQIDRVSFRHNRYPAAPLCLRDQGALMLNDPLSFGYMPSSSGRLAFSNHATARFLSGPRGAGAGSAASTQPRHPQLPVAPIKSRITPTEGSVFAKGGAVAAVWRAQRLRGVWDWATKY
jgi:hypothetical protein